jgi:hypothetical protein
MAYLLNDGYPDLPPMQCHTHLSIPFMYDTGVLEMRGGLQMLELTHNYHNFVSKARSQKS